MTVSPRAPARDPGLQRERTVLAWNRTALALVGNGVLVLVRGEHAFPLPVAVALSALAFAVAGVAVVHASWRSGILRQSDEQIHPPRAVVVVFGSAVAGLCLASAASIVVWH